MLSDFLFQYFDPMTANRGFGSFCPKGLISNILANELNKILKYFEFGQTRIVISSVLAFIEISRSWERLVQDRYSIDQFYAFICQIPEWFSIAPIDEDLIPYIVQVPSSVQINDKIERIEWTDCIHVATTISRQGRSKLATTDRKIQHLKELNGRLL